MLCRNRLHIVVKKKKKKGPPGFGASQEDLDGNPSMFILDLMKGKE